MSLAERIADALGGKKSTPDGYVCRCPCHDDRAASLSLKDTDAGLLVNCFAGCEWREIKAELDRRGLLPTKNAPAKSKPPNKYYVYKDLVGNVLCRKVKTHDKKMWFERLDGNEWRSGLAGMVVPLYNLQAVRESSLVYLCEGEKDAETLISAGLVGTTNHAGAKSWASHLTEQLREKTVVVIPDNDDAGRKRVAILSKALQGVVKELRLFVPDNVPEHGDITDWVNAGNDPAQILSRSTVIEKRKESKQATRQEYFELIESVLDHPKKCIFTDRLMYLDKRSGLWNPAINAIEIIKSEALFQNETREAKFSASSILPHFFVYEGLQDPEFLVDVPDWDGHDRISDMASLVTLKPDCGISGLAFCELLKEWCGLVFRRMYDPMVQNRILVLQGDQGIGKDTWTSMLVDGLGQFCLPLALVKEDKDTYLSLHRGLIMKISEFDKTSKTEVSTLKDIITAPSTNIRAPYDKDGKVRLCRCSFISSANVQNILRDYTGNRRYMIFELQSIEYAYEGWTPEQIKSWQMQCLAQMRELGLEKYQASPESWRQMRDYIEAKTPSNPHDDLKDRFLQKLRSDVTFTRESCELSLTDDRAVTVMLELTKESSMSLRTIKEMLRHSIGKFRRVGESRFWVLRIPALEPQDAEPVRDGQESMHF